MPDQPPVRLVDSRGSAFVSFAPPDPAALGSRGRTPARTPIAVGPGRASIAEPNRDSADVGFGVTYPIQAGKIQPPNLRDETLARTRLLDWLDVKIHRRLVFVIADAGYGKTTLLADFSRRTRLRTIWYRLDEEDRDWVGFLAHLVAAGREHDPGFAPRTASILRSLEPGGPTREDAIEAFIDELPAIAIDGAALILDDFHLADEVADIRLIAREIVARGPERLSIVFASRRPPSIPVSKWRTMGELAELGIADLRFSDTEMEQLFRETFGRPLEPDVLAELARRTEGWAASLTLVQAALRERTPAETRSFVRGLSGARDELHDYLAEEVVGDLPVVQQQFLMRTSLLQRVTPELAQVATDLEASEVQSMITEAERLGLLGRRAKRRSAEQRYHPLVREFLEDRLRREIGPTGVDELHVKIARWAEPNDWRTAAYHYAAARELEQLSVVLDVHLGTIVGSGAFTAAGDYLGELGSSSRSFASEVIRSRLASLAGDANQAMHHATTALNINPVAELALSNLAASAILAGEIPIAIDLARQLAESATGEDQRAIGIALQLMFEASLEGDLIYISRHLEEMAETNRIRGHTHYEGVSLLNASLTHRARGNVEEALRDASRAVDSLRESSSGSELASALFSLAWPFAWAGDLDRARETMQSPSTFVAHASKSELSYEQAALESELGSVDAATVALSAFDRSVPPTPYVEIVKATRVLLSIRLGEFDAAVSVARSIDPDIASAEPGRRTKVLALMSLVSAMTRSPDRQRLADRAIELADRQGANVYGVVARLARADDSASLASVIVATPERLRPALGIGAELIVSHLEHLPDQARDVIRHAALQHPVRWRDALRFALARGAESERGFAAGRLLEQIGTLEDVPVLRALARRSKSPSDRALGRDLARRLSPRVVVRDLGPMRIEVGPVVLSAGSVRRKVLSLLCFLLTRPQMSANREEVMDALWPEMDPAGASNSLNQTIYFLRRVIEPQYDDETSPGYVRQESDLVYLDPDLIDSTSRHAARLIGRIDQGETHLVDDLSRTYTDRFAADFAYEDWAVDYREWLHVSYLQIVERAIATGIEAGQFEKTLPIARRALETEPRLESLLLSLLKLLKGAGAHAAAAEQYERYATILRHDIGVDPPPFEAV